ncbi:MAG TPA: site-2 protease family protein [Candidatus Babeliales bacterium]|nr:site-2 protease family protein [Candidatus Babeliales bacterium]
MVLSCIASLMLICKQLLFILLGFFGMGFLIGFHELGHFLFAKLFKIRVPSFSLGFGPRLLTKKIGETEFCLSAIPFGGYVEIAGASEVGQGDQKDAFATDEHSFAIKPFYQKFCVMIGGILFNLIFAYFIMIFLFVTGIPKTPLMPNPTIAVIQQGSAAEKAGLIMGDRIISIDDQNVEHNFQRIQQIIHPLAQKTATIVIERNGEKFGKVIAIDSKIADGETIGVLGVEFDFAPTPPHSLKEAFALGISACNRWIKNTFIGLSQLFTRKGINNVAGPIMIISMTVKGAAAGFQIFLLLLVLISINLAVLNLIPLPILDGGQILFYSIEALIQRPIPHKVREYIHIATWIMFLILFLYLSAQDIYCIASPYIDSLCTFFKIR